MTLALVLALLGIQVSTAPAAFAAAVSVSPGAGEPGSSATVSGSAFLPLVPVNLCWDGQECSGLGSTVPDAAGGFSVGITIPSGSGAGSHSISACQLGTGCATTGFEVLSVPDDSSTVPSTTATTNATTTTSRPTTTTSSAPTTTRGPTTTLVGPTTTFTTPTTTEAPQTTGTTEAIAAPAQVTSTTTGFTSETSLPIEQPLVEAAASPFGLDIEGLISQLFAPDPLAEETEGAAAGDAPATGAPVAPGLPVDQPEEDDDDGGSSLALEAAGTGFQLPRFGIWIIWLVVIIGSTGLVLTADELRRRRNR